MRRFLFAALFLLAAPALAQQATPLEASLSDALLNQLNQYVQAHAHELALAQENAALKARIKELEAQAKAAAEKPGPSDH